MMNQRVVSTKTSKAKGKSNVLSMHLGKTRLCKFNIMGTCFKGSDCGFAHTDEELKPLPNLSRTRLCPVLLQTGRCDAKSCTYAHSHDELVLDSSRKTKFCRFFQIGKCNLGTECRFAHSADELKEAPGITEKPQQRNQQYNNAMAIPTIFDTPPIQASDLMVPQHLIANDQECNPPGKMELTRGCSTSTQDSDGYKSCSLSSDGTESEVETFDFSPQTFESSAWDFPPNYGEGQEPFNMVPPMWNLPVLPGRVQQPSGIGTYTGDSIDHFTGPIEIMQTPLAEETCDDDGDGMWPAFPAVTDYQVKNTFISVEDEPSYYPLRCIRSCAGRLTEAA